MSYPAYYTHMFSRKIRRLVIFLGAIAIPFLLLVFWNRAAQKKPLPSSERATTAARVQNNYGKLPLSFEANQGQAHDQVKFLTRAQGQSLYLTSTETVLELHPTQTTKASALRMQLIGANPRPRITGEAKLEATTNYFIGNDPKQWRTNIPTYGKVKYERVYPGIDVVYYGNQQQLEYDFIVQPNTDPTAIKMGFDGAQHLLVDTAGDLVIETKTGAVKQHKPLIYQETNGQRQEITGHYVLDDSQHVSFAVGDYDTTKTLVIDPVLSYSTFLGATKGQDSGSSIAVDAAGCAYITGFSSIDFPHTTGAYYPTFKPEDRIDRMQAIFVMKLNPSGTAPLYSALIGGTEGYSYPREGGYPDDPPSYELSNTSQGISVDAFGNAYVIGRTVTKNFPITPNAFRKTSVGFIETPNYTIDGVVFKLNARGTQLDYSTYLGSIAKAIAVDAYGAAWVTGVTSSRAPMATTPDAYQTQLKGASDAFLTHLKADGSGLIYSTYFGGSTDGRLSNRPGGPVGGGGDSGSGLALDKMGNVYLTGTTSSMDFPKTPGAFTVQEERGAIIVAKFTAAGKLVYSTSYGNLYSPYNYPAIAVDDAGNAYITSQTYRNDFPVTFGAFQTIGGAPDLNTPNIDAFVTKINADGSYILYSTYLGGINGNEYGLGIAADRDGNAYVVGYEGANQEKPNDFPATDTTYSKNKDAGFVVKLNPTGTELIYSVLLGDTNVRPSALALDGSGNVYITGGARFGYPTTPNSYQPNWEGLTEAPQGRGYYDHAFVTKITATLRPEPLLPGPSPKPTPVPPPDVYNIGMLVRDSNGLLIIRPDLKITGTLPVSNELWYTSIGYIFFERVPAGGDYTVTVAAPGYTFTPSSYTLNNLRSNQTLNFTAIVTPTAGAPSISGKVVDRPGLRGVGVAGVTVTLNETPPRTIVTDETGKFVFGNLIAGLDYTIAVSRGSDRFDPAQQVFTGVSGNQTAPNFVMRPPSSAKPVVNVSAASYTKGLSCESIATAFGSGLATTTRSNNLIPMPTVLGGTSVFVKDGAGIERMAPLFFVSPTQVNYLIPLGTASGNATITIVSGDGTAYSETLQIENLTPSLFTADATGRGIAAATVQRIQASGAQSYEAIAQFDFTRGQFMPLPINLGAESERVYLTLYGTGIRNCRDLTKVSAKIGGVDARVAYVGAQGVFAGLDQINVLLPRNLLGRGEVDVTVNMEGKAVNTVRVKIQ